MVNQPNAKLLRIFVGEYDKVGHSPLYEELVYAAKRKGLAGATVIKGVMSYGANSLIHKSKLLDISHDLPVIVEIVDSEDNINDFLEVVDDLFEQSKSGGLVTIEKANVKFYHPDKEDRGRD